MVSQVALSDFVFEVSSAIHYRANAQSDQLPSQTNWAKTRTLLCKSGVIVDAIADHACRDPKNDVTIRDRAHRPYRPPD